MTEQEFDQPEDEEQEELETQDEDAEQPEKDEDLSKDIEEDCDAVVDEKADDNMTVENITEAVQQDAGDVQVTVESVIEAVLFASDEPLSANRLAAIAETTAKQVRQAIEGLNEQYRAGNRAFRIEQIAGGYQMLTLGSYNHWLQKLLRARGDSKLSAAALETLAIIAYKQPIIRADIEAIRGVQTGEMIRSLMYKGLVKIVGRAEVLGRPMLYGTTKRFLEVFGLNSLKDLPKVEELKRPEQ